MNTNFISIIIHQTDSAEFDTIEEFNRSLGGNHTERWQAIIKLCSRYGDMYGRKIVTYTINFCKDTTHPYGCCNN